MSEMPFDKGSSSSAALHRSPVIEYDQGSAHATGSPGVEFDSASKVKVVGGISFVQSASGTTADGANGACIISGAGTGGANGTWICNGSSNGKPSYGLDGRDPVLYSIKWVSTSWRIAVNGLDVYRSTDNVAFPWLVTTWILRPDGANPLPVTTQSAGLTVNFPTPLLAGSSVIAFISTTDGALVSWGTPLLIGGGAANLSLSEDTGLTAPLASIWKKTNVAGGETGISMDIDAAVRLSLQVIEVRSLIDAVAESTKSYSGNTSEPGIDMDSMIPTSAANLLVQMGAWTSDEYLSGPSVGWTRIGTGVGGGAVWQEAAYMIQSVNDAGRTIWELSQSDDVAVAGAAFGGS